MSKSVFALTVMVLLAAMGWRASRMFPHALDALNPPPSSAPAEYQTSWEKRSKIAFPDKTRIEMNVNTDLHVTEVRAERRINLAHGEAWAIVTRDPSRPTLLCTDGVVLRSGGGTFNVVGEVNSTVVTVVDGDLLVAGACDKEGQQKSPGRPASFRLGGSDLRRLIGTRLVANEQMTVVTSPDGIAARIRRLTASQSAFATSWRAGILTFEGVSLGEAIDSLNRNCNVQIELSGREIAGTQLGGSLDLRRGDAVGAFLLAIKEIYEIVPAPADPSRPNIITLVRSRSPHSKERGIIRSSTGKPRSIA